MLLWKYYMVKIHGQNTWWKFISIFTKDTYTHGVRITIIQWFVWSGLIWSEEVKKVKKVVFTRKYILLCVVCCEKDLRRIHNGSHFVERLFLNFNLKKLRFNIMKSKGYDLLFNLLIEKNEKACIVDNILNFHLQKTE